MYLAHDFVLETASVPLTSHSVSFLSRTPPAQRTGGAHGGGVEGGAGGEGGPGEPLAVKTLGPD